MEKTYTIIVHRVGEKDQIRRGVDKLNSVIIPAEIKMHFAAAFEQGKMRDSESFFSSSSTFFL